MPRLNSSIDTHTQLFSFSCIASAVEMVLKLLGRVHPDYYTLQKLWDDRRNGNFLDVDMQRIEGVTFLAKFSPPHRGPHFPLDQLFAIIDNELSQDRYVIVSLEVQDHNYHNFIIYGTTGSREYLAITKRHQDERISDVRSRIECPERDLS